MDHQLIAKDGTMVATSAVLTELETLLGAPKGSAGSLGEPNHKATAKNTMTINRMDPTAGVMVLVELLPELDGLVC